MYRPLVQFWRCLTRLSFRARRHRELTNAFFMRCGDIGRTGCVSHPDFCKAVAPTSTPAGRRPTGRARHEWRVVMAAGCESKKLEHPCTDLLLRRAHREREPMLGIDVHDTHKRTLNEKQRHNEARTKRGDRYARGSNRNRCHRRISDRRVDMPYL